MEEMNIENRNLAPTGGALESVPLPHGEGLTDKIRQYIAVLFAVMLTLIIACVGLFCLQETDSTPVYAEPDDVKQTVAIIDTSGEAATDETTTDETTTDDEATANKTAIVSKWEFEDKMPVLENLPADAAITYAVHTDDGTTIQESEITDNEKYSVTATLSEASSKSYYFAETGTNTVSLFFVYSNTTTTLTHKGLMDYFPLWAILIITLALIGFIITMIKTIFNIRYNRKDKKEQKKQQKQQQAAYSFGGVTLLAFLGLDVKVWMALAFAAVVLFFIGVIVMLITWKHHNHPVVAQTTNESTNVVVHNNFTYLPPIIAADDDEEEPEEKRRRNPSNFRVRLKASSDKCKEYYIQLKNYGLSYRDVTFRMRGNIEKILYHNEPLAYIGTTKRSLKLFLALNPHDYDEEVYHQKDMSEKKRYAEVPMLVKIGSGRAYTRAQQLLDVLLTKYQAEQKTRFTERDLQLLAYTLAGNALVKDKRAEMLRMDIHVHDADILTGTDAEKYTHTRKCAEIENKNFATLTLDVLDGKFLDGQHITLKKLQQKKLIDQNCNGVRITGGTRLTKPLYVVANEFTLEAIKMIVLTGGKAVKLIEDPDLNNKPILN